MLDEKFRRDDFTETVLKSKSSGPCQLSDFSSQKLSSRCQVSLFTRDEDSVSVSLNSESTLKR